MTRFAKLSACPRPRGFTIIEIMISLVVVGVVVAAVSTLIKQKIDDQTVSRLQLAKTRIIKQMEDAVNDPNNIRASALQVNGSNFLSNAFISQCGSSTAICPPQFTSPTKKRTMDFWVVDGKGSYVQFSGLWSADGQPACIPSNVTPCPFIVNVFYWFGCPVDRSTNIPAASCKAPPYLNITFQLQPSTSAPQLTMKNLNVAKNIGMNFYYPGTSDAFDPKTAAFTLNSSTIFNGSQVCPPNQYLDGTDANGKIICTCSNHNPQRKPNGALVLDAQNHPICKDLYCPDNNNRNRLIGFDIDPATNDWRPKCAVAGAIDCVNVELVNAGDCPPGYYMTKVDFGACTLDSSPAQKKKGTAPDPGSVTCDPGSGKCCRGIF